MPRLINDTLALATGLDVGTVVYEDESENGMTKLLLSDGSFTYVEDELLGAVVVLDVDGVVNVGDGDIEVELQFRKEELPKSPFIKGYGEEDRTFKANIDTTLGVDIKEWQQYAEVVWGSTWEHSANELSKYLGIEPLGVGISVAKQPPRFGYARNHDSTGWKAEAIAERFGKRPLVWVDDRNWQYLDGWWYEGPHLVVFVEHDKKMTAEQRSQVTEFIRRYDGHITA